MKGFLIMDLVMCNPTLQVSNLNTEASRDTHRRLTLINNQPDGLNFKALFGFQTALHQKQLVSLET